MKKKYDSSAFAIAMFLLLLLPVAVGCGDDYDTKINTLTAGLQQAISDLGEATAQLRTVGDGSAATTAKINVLETAFNNLKAEMAALSTDGEASAERLGIILGKLQGLQSGVTDIDRTVINLNRLIAGIADAAGGSPGQTAANMDKVVNYVSKISELEAQRLILSRFLDEGFDEETRRKIEARIREDFRGDMDTLEIHIKKATDASINQMKTDTEALIDQLQSTRYALLESIAPVEEGVSTLNQAFSLLNNGAPDLDQILSVEQITAIAETTVNEMLRTKGVNPELLKELAAKISDINPRLVTLKEAYQRAGELITEVTLVRTSLLSLIELSFSANTKVDRFCLGPVSGITPPKGPNQYPRNVFKTEFTFPQAPYTGTLRFEYGKLSPVSKTVADVIVQVKPADAPFDKSMISLMDVLGNEAINDFIEVIGVTPYTGAITRAETNNGLYMVSFRLKSAEADEDIKNIVLRDPVEGYDKSRYGLRFRGTNQRFFGLVVKTKGVGAAERTIISDFSLIISNRQSPFAAMDAVRPPAFIEHGAGYFTYPRSMNFAIIAHGKREIDRNIKSSTEVSRQEYVWYADYTEIVLNIEFLCGPPCQLDVPDNERKSAKAFNLSEPHVFQVDLYSHLKDNTISDIRNAYGYYIALDSPSSLAAIDNFEGLGKVYTIGQIATVKKTDNRLRGEVGFRIWAVNYDGILVDPDGRGFVINYQ